MNITEADIIIVGAGAAGLLAARELSRQQRVIILEALAYTGGRIKTVSWEHGQGFVEAGAEFIHGDARVTKRLLKEAGLSSTPVEGKMYRREKDEWIEEKEMIEGWDELLRKMKNASTDMVMEDFLLQEYGRDEDAEFRQHVRAFAEGFDIADIRQASVRALYEEWSKQNGEDAWVDAGYGKLISFLEAECVRRGCQVLTNHPVKQIDWERGQATAYTMDGKKFRAAKMIVTVPVSVLASSLGHAAINMTPPVDEYVTAAQAIGFGAVIKFQFVFSERCWPADTGFIFSDEAVPTWWPQATAAGNILTGWVGGPKAAMLSDDDDEMLIEKAILSLTRILGIPQDELLGKIVDRRVYNWQTNVYALGAYSFAMPATPAGRKLLKRPLADTVYFAGEAIYDGPFTGTVEAAFVSAQQVVDSLR